METVTYVGKTTRYAYDENGNRRSFIYDGGVREEYVYDKNNRLLQLYNKKADGSEISSYRYTYDSTGKVTSKTDKLGTTNYSYDKASRIRKVETPGKTTVYAYDKSGNRQTLNETYVSEQPSGYTDSENKTDIKYILKKSEYVYSQTNELLQLVETMLDAAGKKVLEKTTSYLFDENGNEIRQKVSYLRPHSKSMHRVTGAEPLGEGADVEIDGLIEKVSSTYDGFNRLKQMEKVNNSELVTVLYNYDGDGLRTKKSVKSSKEGYAEKVTNYLYDRQHVILETNASDAVQVRYIRGINYIARVDGSNKLSHYLYNGHGDVVQTVSQDGDIENQYDYDIFGNPTLTIETSYSSSIRYAGEFLDTETGLYYLRARYYDPYTARFTSEDTYEGQADDPLSLNRYTYAHNNPLQFIDPTGHSAEDVQDHIDWNIKQIDRLKEEWNSEERNKPADQTEWTTDQKRAHEYADFYRVQLGLLDGGNNGAQQLVSERGNEPVGLWETYKRDRVAKQIERQPVSTEDLYDYFRLNASITVAKQLGRDVVESDMPMVEKQLAHDLGLNSNPANSTVSTTNISESNQELMSGKSMSKADRNLVKAASSSNNQVDSQKLHPTTHGKDSDSDYVADLVQSFTDQYKRLDERESNLKACVVDTICRANQSSIEEIARAKGALEQLADGVRVAYYNLHGLELPNDIKYRGSAVPIPDLTEKINGIMTTYENKYKDYAGGHNAVDTLTTFFNIVQSGGELDLKRQPDFKSTSYFVYSDEMYRKDDAGNMVFGYFGKVFGYSDSFLLGGAGGYQVYTKTSSISWYSSNFDDPRDQLMINLGISIYNNRHSPGEGS